MAKIQRRFKVGSEYLVKGTSKLERRVKCVSRFWVGDLEHYVFRPVRWANKQKPLAKG
jgi:hypothetical protein